MGVESSDREGDPSDFDEADNLHLKAPTNAGARCHLVDSSSSKDGVQDEPDSNNLYTNDSSMPAGNVSLYSLACE
ncbi:hypothetical protein PGT21_031622 [Puccinia graminis f. sp. tritici]|uniref:Uncharacterized protein n=1 Tax=Puccinia graminis f. sp. tritici TaxID=56615 RepID=A0A5B0QP90_PUCGR|nr:hypothetical protein PGT21_031622 [Puccinia graminis f. sp. tritici]